MIYRRIIRVYFLLIEVISNRYLVSRLQAANPFFKLLTMLMEFAGGPPGMPPFASYILQRIWEVNFRANVLIFYFLKILLVEYSHYLKY